MKVNNEIHLTFDKSGFESRHIQIITEASKFLPDGDKVAEKDVELSGQFINELIQKVFDTLGRNSYDLPFYINALEVLTIALKEECERSDVLMKRYQMLKNITNITIQTFGR